MSLCLFTLPAMVLVKAQFPFPSIIATPHLATQSFPWPSHILPPKPTPCYSIAHSYHSGCLQPVPIALLVLFFSICLYPPPPHLCTQQTWMRTFWIPGTLLGGRNLLMNRIRYCSGNTFSWGDAENKVGKRDKDGTMYVSVLEQSGNFSRKGLWITDMNELTAIWKLGEELQSLPLSHKST